MKMGETAQLQKIRTFSFRGKIIYKKPDGSPQDGAFIFYHRTGKMGVLFGDQTQM